MGVIVRTAGVGCTRDDLQRDLDYLLALWSDFEKRLNLGRGPAPLYEESDVAIRTVRDLFNSSTEAVIVDAPAALHPVNVTLLALAESLSTKSPPTLPVNPPRLAKSSQRPRRFSSGIFPDAPSSPGVILAEALAQTAGIAAAQPGRSFLLSAIRSMKFPGAALPEEVIVLKARKLAAFGPLWQFEVQAVVGERVVAEGTIVLNEV